MNIALDQPMKITTESDLLCDGVILTRTHVTYSEWRQDAAEFLLSITCIAALFAFAAYLDPLFGVLWAFGYMLAGLVFPKLFHFIVFARKEPWFRWETTNLDGVVLMYSDSWGVHWVNPELQAQLDALGEGNC
jgi:hypothetical protein